MRAKTLDKSENKEIELYAKEGLSNDDFLRKIYHLGYSTKSMTKTFAKSIVFERETRKIIQLIESKEITIRSCGPLLLGLVRVYDKIVKNFLEDVRSIFTVKSDERKSKKGGLSKEALDEEAKESNEKNESEVLDKRNKEKIMTNFLLTSPLKQGIYSLLAEQTPSKYLSNLSTEKRDLSSIEAFRADISTEGKITEKGSDIKIKENKNVKYIPEASILDENQEGDFNNFFKIISANQKKEGDLIRDLLDSETKINFPMEEKKDEIIDLGDMNIHLDQHKFDEEDIKFTHEIEEKIKEYRTKSKKIRSNFAYDEATSINMETILKSYEQKENLNEDHIDLYKRVIYLLI